MGDHGTSQSFPRTQHIKVGYAPLEDRVLLDLKLAAGGDCKAWLPRRVAGALIQRFNAALKRSHPAAEGAPADDTVMALEHIAARSEIAAAAVSQADEEAREEAAATEPAQQPSTAYVISDAQIEAQESQIRVGLWGYPLTAHGQAQGDVEAVAGLMLERNQAHELLRMLTEQAERAEWGLEHSRIWPRWLERSR